MKSNIPERLQSFLDFANTLKMPETPKEARERTEKVSEAFAIPKLKLPFTTERSFSVENMSIPIRIYHPKPEDELPVILYLHGGGHVTGSLESYDALCRKLADACQCVLMSIGYRLAPEFPYPAGIYDCINAVIKRTSILNGIQADLSQFFLIGDSAGGNLALTATYLLEQQERQAIRGLGLIYPSVDFTMQSNSIQHKGKKYLLTEERIRWFFDHYFAHGGDRLKASPLFFEHLERFPQLYIALAEHDPLVDEGLAFAKKANDAGVKVQLEEFSGMVHGFAQLYAIVPQQVLQLIKSIETFIASCLKHP
ncbi:alpha/beta hydrolase [Legionella nagasakiensis]|uniref:alpha/beta hydrolase n=1 Tax=Legionella nagasakiensis TaxID=535290 RepID=UPI001056DE60|nr:alpha/beta hydrolase [Legionella nagasakiensis]